MTNLQRIRKQRGLTQTQLAKLSGVPLQAIRRLEIGYRSMSGCALGRAIKLADALECEVRDLIDKQD